MKFTLSSFYSPSRGSVQVGAIPVVVPIPGDPDSAPNGIRLHDPSPVMVETRSGDLRRLKERFTTAIAAFSDSDGARDSTEFSNIADSDRRQEEIDARDQTMKMSIQHPSADLLRLEDTFRKAMGDLFSRLDESKRRLDESNRRRDQADRTYDQTLKELRQQSKARTLNAAVSTVSKVDSSRELREDLLAIQMQQNEITSRFVPATNGDPMTELLALKQTGSFADYRDRFEWLFGRVSLPESYAINHFINGLKPIDQKAVRMFMPQTLVHAYALARLQDLCTSPREGNSQGSSSKRFVAVDSEPSYPTTPLFPTPSMPEVTPRRLLTEDGMDDKRARGVCRCDEKQLYLLGIDAGLMNLEFDEDRSLGNEVCVEKNGGNDLAKRAIAADISGVASSSSKKVTNDVVQDFEMKLEENRDGSVEVSGVTDVEETESKDEGQVDSSDKQNVSIDLEVASVAKVEDNDGHQSNLKEVEVAKIGEEHHSTVEAKIELNENRVAENEQALSVAASIALLQNKADISFNSSLLQDEDIINAIEDNGFGAEILPDQIATQSNPRRTLIGQFTIGGMACAEEGISDELEPWTAEQSSRIPEFNKDVSLMSRGMVIIDGVEAPKNTPSSNRDVDVYASRNLKELRDGFVAMKVQNSKLMVKLMADNGGFSFSSSPAPAFGITSPAVGAASGASFGFGTATTSSSTPSSGFASNPSSASSAPSFSFGSGAASSGSSLFGGSSLFCSSSSAAATGSNNFGSAPSSGVFGFSSAGTGQTANAFGSSTPTSTPTPCLFGNTSSSASNTGSIFESGASTTPHPFGSTTASSAPAFGSGLALNSGLFGSSTSASSTATATATTGPQFRVSSAPPGLFGSSAPHKIEEPKHRTERVFQVFRGTFQPFVEGNIQIPNLEDKVI